MQISDAVVGSHFRLATSVFVEKNCFFPALVSACHAHASRQLWFSVFVWICTWKHVVHRFFPHTKCAHYCIPF